MAYNILVSIRAQNEIENAIDFYALYSIDAPLNFITSLKQTYSFLETNPFLRIRYKNIRSIKIKRFPFSIYYIINESQNSIKILSCFHSKRNPKKRPKK